MTGGGAAAGAASCAPEAPQRIMRRSAANGARAPLLLPTKEILPLAIAVPELEVRAEAPLGSGRPALPGPLQEDVFPYLQLGGGRALCRGAHARAQRHERSSPCRGPGRAV